ncbi:MAG: site-specific DNA-methyltransferase [Methylobacter sp.]|nr:site-specific DNA-methyltransferase [Methylobacter sp.]MDP2428321.1 site-specific DNA-methyltransferase [Methylobacter sp.]MDP3055672.1 site-specific DNA-methyltransferase [Methylobacter sp.]MDP3361392.1 site-specific DNA-methyltransferase [Methylobacter sp.]MDZ4220394.1 site-specific DNA-methyltransferase [Methylobacter sp.]
MPTLNWIGKAAVEKHHQDVPYRLLEPVPELSCGDSDSGNLIVQGDNLHALKALLPRYAGQVKCIYIDPPYNTGNEGWVYNDNVNSPEIRKWLGAVVGKEGETLDRHDRWLCMMYPRLLLLKQFLKDDGVILMSLDGNEHRYAELLFDEIFGIQNRVETFVWKKSYGGGAKSKQVVNLHEYILCFAKYRDRLGEIVLPPDENTRRYYKFSDHNHETRGAYRLQPLATNSMDARPNLRYAIPFEGHEIWPEKQWQWSRERCLAAIENDELVIKQVKGKWSVNYKQYLKDGDGEERGAKLYSIIEGIYTQHGTNEVKELFGDGKVFSFPKPPELLQKLIQAFSDKNSLVLDSFAGSGTTAHAVLNLNKQDGGNRKFILVEMDETIATTVTAERNKRVIEGYSNAKGEPVEGLGGGFQFCRLSKEPLFTADGQINADVTFRQLAEFVWLTETKTGYTGKADSPLLGVFDGRAIYLLYNGILGDKDPDKGNVLTPTIFKDLPVFQGQKIIYATAKRGGDSWLKDKQIIVKQTPYALGK